TFLGELTYDFLIVFIEHRRTGFFDDDQLPLVEGVGAVKIVPSARAPALGMYLSAIGCLTGGLSDDLSIFQALPSRLCRRPMILVERHIDIARRHRNGVRIE